MAKTAVFNEVDPCIAVTLNQGSVAGVTGTCTECGKPMHWWSLAKAVKAAQAHVDGHAPVLWGGDRASLVR